MTTSLKKVLGLGLALAVASTLPAFAGDCGGCGSKKDKETKPEEKKASLVISTDNLVAGDCGGCSGKKDKETKPADEKKA